MRWPNPCVLPSTTIPSFPTKCISTVSKPSVTERVWNCFLTDVDGPAVNVASCGPKLCLTIDAIIAAAQMTRLLRSMQHIQDLFHTFVMLAADFCTVHL